MFDRIKGIDSRRVVIVILALAVAGVALAPTILAASAPPVIGSAPLADLSARQGGPGRILRGDATVLKRDGTTATIHFERGEITSANSSSIVIKGADGRSATFGVGPDTRVRGSGKRLQLGDVKVGARVAVLSAGGSTGSPTAAVIRLLPSDRVKAGAGATGTPATPTPTN